MKRKTGKSMFQTKKTRKTMKKTIWSLAALMLMAAPVMTSCSNDLDEVAPIEEAKGNVVTLTIALPEYESETRVAVNSSLKITGWENGDEVTLYKATPGESGGPDDDVPASISGDGVVFTYSNTIGEFSGTLPDDKTLDDYNLAVFGGTAVNFADEENYGMQGGINIMPIKWSSTELKEVIMMGSLKDSEGKFTMQVINNVMKIENQSGADVTVAWYGHDYYPEKNRYFELASQVRTTWQDPLVWRGASVNNQGHTAASTVPTFTLENGVVTYVNFPMVYSDYDGDDKIGLYKTDGTATQDATAVVTMKAVSSVLSDGFSAPYAGKLIRFDVAYDGVAY